jgi:hypothetical protein
MLQALLLDPGLYAQLQADPGALRHALAAVAAVAVLHAIGGTVRATAVGEVPAHNFLLAFFGELSFWFAGSYGIYAAGRLLFGAEAGPAALLAAFAYAAVPGLIVFFAGIAPRLGLPGDGAILLVAVLWRLAAGYVAVRQTLALGPAAAGLTLGAGLLTGAGAVALLLLLLRPLHLS